LTAECGYVRQLLVDRFSPLWIQVSVHGWGVEGNVGSGRRYATWGWGGRWSVDFMHGYHRVVPLALKRVNLREGGMGD